MEKIKNKKIDLKKFIENINKDIFNWELSDIIELTYAYTDLWNWKFLNRTLFEDFTQLKFDDHNLEKLYYTLLKKLDNKKQVIEKYKEQLKTIDMEKERKEILFWSLEYVLNSVKLAILWSKFEYEKAWWNLNMTDSEKLEIIKQMENIEKELYDWKVIDNHKEVKQCYDYLNLLLTNNFNLISKKEKEIFERYIKILKERINIKENSDLNNEKTNKEKKDDLNNNILQKKIKRDDYIKIFQIVFDIYDINKPIIVDERSSIYDGQEALYIPSGEQYNELTVKRILQLIAHEIEVHFIIEKNNKQNLWDFRWWKNLNREEWTSKLSEEILFWKTLDDITITSSLPDVLMWEILSWKDYENYLKISFKLKWWKYSIARLLRKKRNYPFNYAWVQHKDTSYSRWIQQVVDYLKSWKDPKDLFLWKVSFEDMSKIKKLSEDKKQLYPLFVAELLLYVLNWNKIYHKDFLNNIKQKYPFLDVDKEYNKHWTVEKVNFNTKRKLVEILKTIKN